MNRLFALLVLSTLLMSPIFLESIPLVKGSEDIFVPTDFPTIQDAINNSADGDTIHVLDGPYFEHVIVNKTVTLIGEGVDSIRLDGSGTGTVLNITADNVIVTGFTIRNSGSDALESGVCLFNVSGCNLLESNIAANHIGVRLRNASNSLIYHNNFIDNTIQVYVEQSDHSNFWDVDYPEGGNYWSDYSGLDDFTGPDQDQPGSDGIGDTHYLIDEDNVDDYPLMVLWGTPPRVHNISTGLDYVTIQQAINASATLNGHVIAVDAGVYREHVIVGKAVSLVGESVETAIIDGSGLGSVVNIKVDEVSIENFTVRNSGSNSGNSGILVSSSFSTIRDNIVTNSSIGISLNTSNANIIQGNYIAHANTGIRLQDSDENLLEYNNVTEQYANCLNLLHSDNNESRNNILDSLHMAYGVRIYSSNNNTISGNTITMNNYGIWLLYSANNELAGNTIRQSYSGIFLDSSSENVIGGNAIEDNTIGVSISFSSTNRVYYNNFVDNEYQTHIYPLSCVSIWNFSYPTGGNYWDDYAGVDVYSGPYQDISGSDGLGDEPYVINDQNQDSYPQMHPVTVTTKVNIHDIAVVNVIPFSTEIYEGYPLNITVIMANAGNFSESFSVTAYYDTTIISTKAVSNMPASSQTALTFIWDTTGLPFGSSYTVKASATTVAGEKNLANNEFVDGTIHVGEYHDVAVEDVTLPLSHLYTSQSIDIVVKVANKCNYYETFNVTIRYNDNLIESQTVTELAPKEEMDLTFNWNLASVSPCRDYTIWAEASLVVGEIDVEDNKMVYGDVYVRLMGDVDGNGAVNILDISAVAIAFGADVGSPKYQEYLDFNLDGVINIIDIAAAAANFGSSCA
jgi:parallel beta-helix repeat protein